MTAIEAGNAIGAIKVAARRIGTTVEEYEGRRAAGQKWCTACKAWHLLPHFPVDRSRGDGLKAKCLEAEHGKPYSSRDPVRQRARSAVMYAVRSGHLPRPGTLACGHHGEDRRHEYDHHRGYEPAHHLVVEPVCTLCHADREKQRRG